jgi:hypothetical protein
MSEPTMGERMFHEITTLEEGQAYIEEITVQLEAARKHLDELTSPLCPADIHAQRLGYANLNIRYGRALGALTTLMHCRILNDESYNRLRLRVDSALKPRVVGVASR